MFRQTDEWTDRHKMHLESILSVELLLKMTGEGINTFLYLSSLLIKSAIAVLCSNQQFIYLFNIVVIVLLLFRILYQSQSLNFLVFFKPTI